jgi:hypothetical protein
MHFRRDGESGARILIDTACDDVLTARSEGEQPMERSKPALIRTFQDFSARPWQIVGWPPDAKVCLVAALLVSLGVFTYLAVHEVSRESITRDHVAKSTRSPVPLSTTRPAFTADEEAYIRSLWPIHGDVERGTMRMSLGEIYYSIHDMGQAELRKRVDEALNTYRLAEKRLRALRPPSSLQRSHEDYLAAIRLFQASATEVRKMFQDGHEDHLRAAHPLSLEGSNKIRKIGYEFWPDEFPPN